MKAAFLSRAEVLWDVPGDMFKQVGARTGCCKLKVLPVTQEHVEAAVCTCPEGKGKGAAYDDIYAMVAGFIQTLPDVRVAKLTRSFRRRA